MCARARFRDQTVRARARTPIHTTFSEVRARPCTPSFLAEPSHAARTQRFLYSLYDSVGIPILNSEARARSTNWGDAARPREKSRWEQQAIAVTRKQSYLQSAIWRSAISANTATTITITEPHPSAKISLTFGGGTTGGAMTRSASVHRGAAPNKAEVAKLSRCEVGGGRRLDGGDGKRGTRALRYARVAYHGVLKLAYVRSTSVRPACR